jgi:hypothetical protein
MAEQYANQEFAEEGDVFEAAQQLPPGLPAVHHIRSLDLKLDPAFLAGINASRRGELRILVEAAGAVLAEQAVQINLLPPSHWGGVNSAPELLAAFVRPTDPSIDVILREASDKLAAGCVVYSQASLRDNGEPAVALVQIRIILARLRELHDSAKTLA